MKSIMDASVVDLPEPVMPVTRSIPRRSMERRSRTFGRCSSWKAGVRSGKWRKTPRTSPIATDRVQREAAVTLAQQALGGLVDEFPRDQGQVVLHLEMAVDPEDRLRARFEVQVGSLALRRLRQQLLEFHRVLAPTWPPSPGPAAAPLQPA